MPTPVTVARQCLTPDAAQALDEAVSVARRRGHAQTTSLHAVSALLSLPSSTLREACARARNCAYSPRLQFKALELCLSVSLDRVSSSQLTEDPPVSNSLMAAIKRSQANQRRQPENFHLYHHLPHAPPHSSSSSSSASSVAIVKVELQHLILSILDDPVVSRVFSEAGFRSSEIKLAIVRPLQSHLYKFPRSRAPPPPIFLYNYPGENPDPVPGRRGLGGFTFPGFGGFLGGDDESRRIGEVLVKRKKNPLLLGVCADAALRTFRESVEENNKSINKSNDNIKKNTSVLPAELSGLDVVSIENDISRFIVENGDDKSLSVRFEEVGRLVEQNLGPGVVVNYGDLKVFVDGDDDVKNDNNGDDNGGCGKSDAASLVVAHLTRLVQLYGVKVWLIGAAATYETYSKFVSRFPSIDKDWNLELLPITSLRPAAMAGSFPKSSLMESFVPFGGFFSTPSDFKNPLNGMFQGVSRCHQCNEKCEQEIAAFSKGGSSITDQYQSSLPSWLQMAESGVNKGLHVEAKDDRRALSAKVTEVQKKWDDLCRTLHHNQPFPKPSIYQVGSQFPTVMGFRFLEDKKETANNSINTTKAPPNENNCVNVNSGIPIDLENVSASNSALPFSTVSKCKNESFLSKLLEKPLKADAESGGLRSTCSLSNSSVGDGSQTSPTSVTSVTTDLGLGLSSAPTSSDLKKRIDEDHADFSPQLSGCFSANVDIVNDYLPAQSSSSSCPELHRPFDLSNFKMLCSALSERVGWQDEAIGMISQCIVNRRKGNENCHGARADIWFNFAGPDRSGKRKIAIALAEILYGSKENLICADLSSQDGVINTDPIFSDQDASGYCLEFRGKTPVDYVAGELCQKPLSVVFLENVDKADLQARNSLSKAIQSGKFSDSHGREVSISNAIFVTTSALTKDCKIISSCTYSEERILRAKSRPIRIQIEPVLGNSTNSQITRRKDISNPNPILVNKRKLTGTNEYPEKHDVSEIVKRAHRSPNRNLDLNLPAEGDELKDTDDGSSDNDSFESSKSWLQNFYDQPVETVVFKQFDFDTLAKKFFEDINKSFHKVVGPICLLEIDSKVMEQLLAAAYLSNRNRVVEDWLENVLSMEFVQVRKRYNLTSHSIVKLITCLDCFPEEQTPGVCFPPKIVMN